MAEKYSSKNRQIIPKPTDYWKKLFWKIWLWAIGKWTLLLLPSWYIMQLLTKAERGMRNKNSIKPFQWKKRSVKISSDVLFIQAKIISYNNWRCCFEKFRNHSGGGILNFSINAASEAEQFSYLTSWNWNFQKTKVITDHLRAVVNVLIIYLTKELY